MARVVSGFRSGPSRKVCGLQFRNKTYRTVSIIWVDYYGKETTYLILEPRDVKSVFSYEGHPWLCRDTTSKKCLLLNNTELFVPSFPSEPNGQMELMPVFFEVNISIPLFSLQDICSDLISQCVSNEKDIRNLELPARMKDLIVDCFRNVKDNDINSIF